MIAEVLADEVAASRVPRAGAPTVADILATLPWWWQRRAVAAGLRAGWTDWRRTLPPPPLELGGSCIPWLLDATPEQFGDAYVRALNPDVRAAEGRHYTPPTLAEELWRMVLSAASRRMPALLVDPAAGAGSLLLPALRQMVKSSPDAEATLERVGQQVAGVDLDSIAVWLGNAFLAAELLPLWSSLEPRRRRDLPQLLHVGDGLDRVHDRPEAIVMNPPYGRVRLSNGDRERWSRSLYGHSNRYAMFLHAAIERVAPGGVVAAVLPTSFLGGAYYQRLREMIAEDAPLVALTFIESRTGVYSGDPLQETCLAVFQKAGEDRVVSCRRLHANGAFEISDVGKVAISRPFAAPWPIPRRLEHSRLVVGASRLRHRLADYGWSVSTGPLVWNRHKPQIGAWGSGRVPILWAADIGPDGVHRDPARDHQRWIRLRQRDEFMRLTEPAVVMQRTTAPEQQRRLVGAVLDDHALNDWGGAVVVENHVNVLRQASCEGPLDARLLAALLATPTLDALYRCLTGSVAVSAYELEALPLPPPNVLKRWVTLDETILSAAVARYYSG